MFKIMTRASLATGAAGVAVALSATSALASVWTVSGSGGPGGWDAGITTLTVDDTAHSGTTTTLTCQSSHIDISIPNGTSNGMPIGTINSTSLSSSCSFGGFFSFILSASGFPWNLNAVNQPGGLGADVNMTVTGAIGVDISAPGCEADIGGSSVPGVFSNVNKDLNFPGTDQDLTVTNVDPNNNCLDRIHVGDPVSFRADYFTGQPIEIDQTG